MSRHLRHSSWRRSHPKSLSEDYCTIRSASLPTVLDGICPRDRSRCDELHATAIPPSGSTASQEWNLIRLSSLPGPEAGDSLPDVMFPRRPLLLQNVLTGMLATRTEDVNGPNVILTSSAMPTSSWTFIYAENHKGNVRTDCFAIASSSDNLCTMEHVENAHINVRS